MVRLIDKELKQWKDKKGKEVLLLRGARQVGKTYSIRKLSQVNDLSFGKIIYLSLFFFFPLNELNMNYV
jgi:predicted AAA+ superfamily ATPase